MKKLIQYAYLEEQTSGDEPCLMFYESLQDAVSESDGREIYIFKGRRLGRFRVAKKIVRIKPRKKKAKK